MDLNELHEWEAYYTLEPWGTLVTDDYWRQMFALYYSVNTKRGTEQPDWLDRDPEETARIRASMPIENKFEAFFSALSVIEPEGEPPVEPMS